MSLFPINDFLPEIINTLKQEDFLILTAAPGAGKTTLVPPALMKEFSGKILMTEPRRVAAKLAANRIAQLVETPLGNLVGYAVKDESKVSNNTILTVLTCGVLLKKIQNDPELEGINLVIFDEFHTRSLDNDLAFTLLLDIKKNLRPDLKILIMSATLNLSELQKTIAAKVIDVPGKVFPLDIQYIDTTPLGSLRELVPQCIRSIIHLLKKVPHGDMLVFLPGVEYIRQVASSLEQMENNQDYLICQLHGTQSLAEQQTAIIPAPIGKRKIILATNIAESSITINGITIVVDSGWEKRLTFHPENGLSFLELKKISSDSAKQRAGRAGRTAPGTVLRLWSNADNITRVEHTQPEILENDLSSLVLELAIWGSNKNDLTWVTNPPEAAFLAAEKTLLKLGVLNANKRITPIGKEIANLPISPRLATMVAKAKQYNLTTLAIIIASLLENRKLNSSIDLRIIIEDYLKNNNAYFDVKKSINKLHTLTQEKYQNFDIEKTGFLLAIAYPEWIGKKQNNLEYKLAIGSRAQLQEDEDYSLLKEEFIAIGNISNNVKGQGIIRLACPISLEEIKILYPEKFHTRKSLSMDSSNLKLSGFEEYCFDEIVLTSKPATLTKEELLPAIIKEAFRRQIAMPPENTPAARLLERINFAAKNDSSLFTPLNNEKLLDKILEFAPMFFNNVKDFSSLTSASWLDLIKAIIGYEELTYLDKLYPEFFNSPAGGKKVISYIGEIPTISLKIQELYGVAIHPTVGSKEIPLRLELLSPAQRVVQITCDLPGFWQGSYEQVKKEMKSKYPKHNWAEDPLAEVATKNSVKKRA